LKALHKLAHPLTSQLARPHGLAAPIMAPVLNRVNQRVNGVAVAALAVTQGEWILEVGSGGGIGMRLALPLIGAGRLTGVDVSSEIVRWARRRFRTEIADGRVEVLTADVASLPLPDGVIDGAFSVNCVYFWADLQGGFAELQRVLAPGGRLVIAMEANAPALHRTFVSEESLPDAEAVAQVMRTSGFTDVNVTTPRRGVQLALARKR